MRDILKALAARLRKVPRDEGSGIAGWLSPDDIAAIEAAGEDTKRLD